MAEANAYLSNRDPSQSQGVAHGRIYCIALDSAGMADRWGHVLRETGRDIAFVSWASLFDIDERPSLVMLMDTGAPENDWHRALRDLSNIPALFGVPVIVISDTLDVRERCDLFLFGVLGVITTSELYSDRLRELLRDVEPKPLAFGNLSIDEWLELIRHQLIKQLAQVSSVPIDGRTQLCLGDGRRVAATLAGFVERMAHLVAPRNSGIVRKELSRAVSALSLMPARDRQQPLKGLRVLLATSDPQWADSMTRALRKRGALVAVTEGAIAGFGAIQALDPHVTLIYRLDAVEELNKDVRLRWGTLHFLQRKSESSEEVYTDPFERDHDFLRQLIDYLDEETHALRRLLVEGTLTSDIGLWGPGRWLRWLSGLEGSYRWVASDANATVTLEVCDGLLVAASLRWAQRVSLPEHFSKSLRQQIPSESAVEGLEVFDYLLLMQEGSVFIESIKRPGLINLVAVLNEELDKIRILPKEFSTLATSATRADPQGLAPVVAASASNHAEGRKSSVPPPLPSDSASAPTWHLEDRRDNDYEITEWDLPMRSFKPGRFYQIGIKVAASLLSGCVLWYLLVR